MQSGTEPIFSNELWKGFNLDLPADEVASRSIVVKIFDSINPDISVKSSSFVKNLEDLTSELLWQLGYASTDIRESLNKEFWKHLSNKILIVLKKDFVNLSRECNPFLNESTPNYVLTERLDSYIDYLYDYINALIVYTKNYINSDDIDHFLTNGFTEHRASIKGVLLLILNQFTEWLTYSYSNEDFVRQYVSWLYKKDLMTFEAYQLLSEYFQSGGSNPNIGLLDNEYPDY